MGSIAGDLSGLSLVVVEFTMALLPMTLDMNTFTDPARGASLSFWVWRRLLGEFRCGCDHWRT